MVKDGPCCHCGITTTPLWRNGPADKPVLCNACGTRWRTRGTLVNYMPLHAGGAGLLNQLAEMHKRKCSTNMQPLHNTRESLDGFLDVHLRPKRERFTSQRFAEEARMMSKKRSDCWPPWEQPIPSRRRTGTQRQPYGKMFLNAKCPFSFQESSCCEDSEHKASLIPLVRIIEQESQASSVMPNIKVPNPSIGMKINCIEEESSLVQSHKKQIKFHGRKQSARKNDGLHSHSMKHWIPNKDLLENFPYNKCDVLQSCHSPLVFVEMKDIINHDVFMNILTEQEQADIMRYASPVDRICKDDCLSMFNSCQFESDLKNFQVLLSEGMFDPLESGLSPGVLQHYQQLLTVLDLTSSGWTEQRAQILNCGRRKNVPDYKTKLEKRLVQGKRYLQGKFRGWTALKGDTFTNVADLPALPSSSSCTTQASSSSPSVISDAAFGKDARLYYFTNAASSHDGDSTSGSCFSVSSNSHQGPLYKHRNFLEHPFYGSTETDILVHVPSNLSFQQAELLAKPLTFKEVRNEELEQNPKMETTKMLSGVDELDWGALLWNSPSPSSVKDFKDVISSI